MASAQTYFVDFYKCSGIMWDFHEKSGSNKQSSVVISGDRGMPVNSIKNNENMAF